MWFVYGSAEELERSRDALLRDLGPSAPHDLRMLFRSVSRETLAGLLSVGRPQGLGGGTSSGYPSVGAGREAGKKDEEQKK